MPREVRMMVPMHVPFSQNHLLRLAQPLFWVLDELSPELESPARLDALQAEARARLAAFRQACGAAARAWEDVEAIHYCFCAALDQAGSRVRGRANQCRGLWLQHSLLKAGYGENSGGQHCRAWLARLQEDAPSHADALEVIGHLIERGLQDERGVSLADTLPAIRSVARSHRHPAGPRGLPHWRGLPPADPIAGHLAGARMPARWPLVLIGVLLIAALAYLAYRQYADSQVLAQRVDQLSAQIAAQRDPLEERLAHWLAPGLATGAISMDRKGDRIYLAFSGDAGFAAGKADLTPILAQQLDQVAVVLADTASRISVVGHADDSLGPAGSQALNRAVSEARAMAVARYLQARGLMPSRISIVGRGSADPVGDNRTEAGRALNRRVEIVVDRS